MCPADRTQGSVLERPGKTRQQVFVTQGRKRLPFMERIDIRLNHQLPKKPVAGAEGQAGR